jgi:Tfp pilus assembly protein PilN
VSQVNLLPPELRQRQKIRRTTSLVIVAGVALLALIGVFYVLRAQELAGVQDDLAAQNDRNAQLQTQIGELQEFATLQAELEAKQQLVSSLFLNEVSWSSALLDVSRVIPDASYLSNLSGQVAASGAGVPGPIGGGTPETTLIGNMTFQGVAGGTETISSWLTRLEQVQGWVNAWVTNAAESEPFSEIYTFTSGLDLTGVAATERGQGGVQP